MDFRCPLGTKNISLIHPQKSGQLSEESSNSSDFEALSKSSKCSSNTKINKTRTDNSSNNGLLSVLRLYSTWLIMLVITTRGITCSFFQAPLPEHLNSVNPS